MVSGKVMIHNPQGLHMRPAGVFSKAMTKFASSVKIVWNGTETDGKNLLSIISACIKCGAEVEILCEGEDETDALHTAIQLIEAGLGE